MGKPRYAKLFPPNALATWPGVPTLQRVFQGLADVIFPPQCMACGAVLHEQHWSFCPDCFSQIGFLDSPLCVLCGEHFSEPGESNHMCGACLLASPPFSIARAVGEYERVLMDVIHRFKYGGKISLGERLGEFMADFRYPSLAIADYSLVMPVPLHPRRLRQRGFNQAMVLAREISRRFALRLDFLSLRRIVFTEPQVGLGRDMREQNIKGAFQVADARRIKDERIILVDDVYTTGSTVKECARILMKNGAKEVAVLTLARAGK
jgi:ComF family protein